MSDQDGVLTLTDSERSAQQLRRRHRLAQREAGNSAWEVASVFSAASWLRRSWTASWPSGQLLHPAMELALWQRIISADAAASDVISLAALVRLARRAGQLVSRYRIDLSTAPVWNEEQRSFLRWHGLMREELRSRDWLLDTDLPAQLLPGIRAGQVQLPEQLIRHLPVHEPVPALAAVFDCLAESGVQCTVHQHPKHTVKPSRAIHADARQQFQRIAESLATRLAEHPGQSIVLALPDPQARAPLINSSFRPLLSPWLDDPEGRASGQHWSFDGGQVLSAVPAISRARNLAGLRLNGNSFPTVSGFLLDSSSWDHDERLWTSAAELRLRERGGIRFGLIDVLAALPEGCPAELREKLETLRDSLAQLPRRALPSAWCESWQNRSLPWPGNAADSQPAWLDALAALSAMDAVLGECDVQRALGWLDELLNQSRLDTVGDAAITICSLDVAAGLDCDLLVVADLDDSRVPQTSAAMPLINPDLLQAAGVPEATPAGRHARLQRMAHCLQSVAPEVELHCCAMGERSDSLRPSPVFGLDWPAADAPAPSTASAQIEWPAADPVPPSNDAQAEGVRGGSTIFRASAAAPFFALCTARLGILALPPVPRGLPPATQGQIVHRALETIWKQVRSQEALSRLDRSKRTAMVQAAVAPEISRSLPQGRYGRYLVELEQARVCDVVDQWLVHELRRVDPFETIAWEESLTASIAGLDLRLQIDRIDRVRTAGGDRYLVLDYKTGRSAQQRDWNAEKLNEPQLPLYASVAQHAGIPQADGICFAHVLDGAPALVAATNWRKHLIVDDGKAFGDGWPQQLQAWRLSLETLAIAFLAGEAGIELPGTWERSSWAGLRPLMSHFRPATPA